MAFDDSPDAMELGRRYAEMLFGGDSADLWERFAPAMRQLFGNQDRWAKQHAGMLKKLGREVDTLSESANANLLWRQYRRSSRLTKSKKPLGLAITIDGDDMITGLSGQAPKREASSAYLAYQSPNHHSLPFAGAWFVFWGGRTTSNNYHAPSRSQRFATDFLVVKGGRTHEGEGKLNEDYYCYGLPIYATAPGTVVKAVEGVAENIPGMVSPWKPPGNHVVIDHGAGEFSFLCHLKRGSVVPKKGDAVHRGDVVGLCGNSGTSSEPHLHFHMQDKPGMLRGCGMPVRFVDYIVNGTLVADGEPVQGEVVEPPTMQD